MKSLGVQQKWCQEELATLGHNGAQSGMRQRAIIALRYASPMPTVWCKMNKCAQ
jgi:hypothetical protein